MAYFSKPYKVPTGFIKIHVNNLTRVVTKSDSSDFTTLGTDLKTGASMPNYKGRIKAGLDASTSYTRESWDVRPGIVNMRTKQIGGGVNAVEDYFLRHATALPVVSGFTDMSLCTTKASDRIKRKLQEHSGHSNQLTNLAELREVPKTIRSVAQSAGKLVSIVANSKKRGGDLRKFASDQWLTWSFGVLPTLGAVDDAISSVQKYLERDDHVLRDYGIFGSDSKTSTTITNGGSIGSNIIYNGSFDVTKSCKISLGHRFEVNSANSYDLPKHLGFDISSVVPTAWELLPYSWLIDYFTTAGDFLEDTFAAEFGSSIYICQNTLLRIKGIIETKPKLLNSSTSLDNWFSVPCKYEYYKFTRSPLSQLPRAPLRIKTKEEIASNAVNKLLNLTAILAGKR